MKRFNQWPSGPRQKTAKGLFKTAPSKSPKTPKNVVAAQGAAGMVNGQYTSPTRKLGGERSVPKGMVSQNR